jgi:hypothetical protein
VRKLVVLALALSLAGVAACTTNIPITEESIQAHVVVSYDPYLRTQSITAPPIGGIFSTNYRLVRSGRDGITVDLLSLRYMSEDWAFLNSAHDIDGAELRVVQPSRDVISDASVIETLGVQLPPGYLEKHIDGGLNIRVDGARGYTIALVPAPYIRGFLGAAARVVMDKYASPDTAR